MKHQSLKGILDGKDNYICFKSCLHLHTGSASTNRNMCIMSGSLILYFDNKIVSPFFQELGISQWSYKKSCRLSTQNAIHDSEMHLHSCHSCF